MKPVFDPVELAAACGGRWTRWPSRPVTGVIHDTRLLEPGDLFVPLTGARDGHAYMAAAFEKGAAGSLAQEDRPLDGPWPILKVKDTGAALQALAAWHRARFDFSVVGITGSVGKTTVKEMVAAALESQGPTVRTYLNWNNSLGLPLSLLRAIPKVHRHGVFEIGTNHPGEIEPLAKLLQPDVGIVTGIGPVHLEHFGTLEAIAREKGALLAMLGSQGIAVINRDTPCFEMLAERVRGRLVSVSLETEDATWRVVEQQEEGSGWQTIRVAGPDGVRTARVPRPGRHHALNATLALATAVELGLTWEQAVGGLERGLKNLPMRWQPAVVGGIGLINDAYNANPLSMRGALETFAVHAAEGRKWLVLGEMRELGPRSAEFHEALGRCVAVGPWAGVILVRSAATDALARGALEAGLSASRLHQVSDADEAAETLRGLIRKGDWILLKASRGVALERVAERLGFPVATED